jgi:hypothetical protein
VLDHWLSGGQDLAPAFAAGERQGPEFRIAEDARVVTEIPVDLAFGLVTAVLTAVVFIGVLWRIGGTLEIDVFGMSFMLPAYLVIGAVLYSATLTTAMLASADACPGRSKERTKPRPSSYPWRATCAGSMKHLRAPRGRTLSCAAYARC